MSKKKGELTYFLDHPQIKRNPSPGNGNSPGFFGQLASGKLGTSSSASKPSDKQTSRPTSASSSSKPSSGSSSSWQKAFSKGFKGK